MNTLTLQPFSLENIPSDVGIAATVLRQKNWLVVQFALADPQSQVMVPPRSDEPLRRDDLWQATCFELFVAPQTSTEYWEFNWAPSGDWNAYHFDTYRQGMREESAFIAVSRMQHQTDGLLFDANIELDALVRAEQSIDVSVTAVLQFASGDLSYWAIAHYGVKPDFHLRSSFTVTL